MTSLHAIGETASCQACTIRNRAICADLDASEVAILNGIARRRRVSAGEKLLWEGEEALLVANVLEGVLKLTASTVDGKTQILGLCYPSDFVGRPYGDVSPHNVEALTDAVLCVFPRADFERFALAHPRLEHKLLERTLTELDRARRWMLLLGRMTAEQRIVSFLLELSKRAEPAGCTSAAATGPVILTLPLTRQQIADILGLTLETVSRGLAQLKNRGFLALPAPREIAIKDIAALASVAG